MVDKQADVMGLFSRFKKAQEPASAPSLDAQKAEAKASVDAYLKQVTGGGADLSKEGSYSCAYFRIAGITHHCNFSDVGMVRGVTFNDKNNPYDKSAVGILDLCRGKERFLGFIPKEDKKEYKKFAGDEGAMFCIGYIRSFEDSEGQVGLLGRIKVCKGSGRAIYDHLVEDTQLLLGVFRGYYGEQLLKENGDKIEWILDRHFWTGWQLGCGRWGEGVIQEVLQAGCVLTNFFVFC